MAWDRRMVACITPSSRPGSEGCKGGRVGARVLRTRPMDRPSIRQLECLVGVAEHGSFRRAAAALGISQPALSAQVQLAEDLLGVQVFERDRRSVLITPAGEEAVARARDALASIDAVAQTARRRGDPLV